MKKYELNECSVNIKYKNRFDIKEGCTINNEGDATRIKVFETKDEALEELKKYSSSVCKFNNNNIIYFDVTEYLVVEVEYDADGEEVTWGDIWFSKMNIELVTIPKYDTIGVFDNMEEAEKAEKSCEVECYLKF